MENELGNNIKLADEIKRCIDVVESTSQNLFITGAGGSGKTTLAQLISKTTLKKHFILFSSSTTAAHNQGQTIRSFFKLSHKLIRVRGIQVSYTFGQVLQALELIILDDASIVRADVMDGIDHVLQIGRHKLGVPFGGVQIILFGDLHQLPPSKCFGEQGFFDRKYRTPYFFSASSFQEGKFRLLELKNSYRQNDRQFKDLLDRVRTESITAFDVKLLRSRANPLAYQSLASYITLTPKKETAERINTGRLNGLPGREKVYRARTVGEYSASACPVKNELKLKINTQVVMVTDDTEQRWAKGCVGVVVGLTKDFIEVRIENKVHKVSPVVWRRFYYYTHHVPGIFETVSAAFEQYPVKLGWAMTIHESLGLTFDNVIIDLEGGALVHEVYVALSRCRSLEGLLLMKPLKETDLIYDRRIHQINGYCSKFIDFSKRDVEASSGCVINKKGEKSENKDPVKG